MLSDVLAFRLLKSANLKPSQQELAKATISTLDFETMKAHLKKVHEDISSYEIKEEELEEGEQVLFASYRGRCGRGNFRGTYRGLDNTLVPVDLIQRMNMVR